MEWVLDNKEWLFSGIGLSIIGVVGYFIKRKSENKIHQSISSGKDSTNIQGGNNVDVTIGDKNDK